ncbi:MAG: nuclear transport factor 2 family protein, partial [Myxococcota bacterium]
MTRTTAITLMTMTLTTLACATPNTETTTMTTTHPASSMTTTDHDALSDTIQTIFSGVDAHRWDEVKGAMTPTVQVDYSALGGPSGAIASEVLVDGWMGFLPRFDRTVHNVHNVAIHVAGDRATATFDGIAVHTLRQESLEYWTVFAGYDTEYEKEDGVWKLARIDLTLYGQAGNLELPAIASKQAPKPHRAAVPHPTVENFFKALESNNLEMLLGTLTQDAAQEMPLAPQGFPGVVEGRDALQGLFSNIIGLEQRYTRQYHTSGDDQVILVSFEGDVRFDQGNAYTNAYVNLFELDEEGSIKRVVEHFNPNTLLGSWPGLSSGHHSVHEAGAATEAVEVEQITFTSGGDRLVGHLFTPVGLDRTQRHPAVVVVGSWTSVKEQMPDMYASRLAEQGFITLTFDFAGFGESAGLPRQLESPARKIQNIKDAVIVLGQRQEVDPSAISGLGICAGAGYMAHAVAQDERFSGLLLIAPWLHNEAMARMIYDARPVGAQGLIDASRRAQARFEEQGTMAYVLATSE